MHTPDWWQALPSGRTANRSLSLGIRYRFETGEAAATLTCTDWADPGYYRYKDSEEVAFGPFDTLRDMIGHFEDAADLVMFQEATAANGWKFLERNRPAV